MEYKSDGGPVHPGPSSPSWGTQGMKLVDYFAAISLSLVPWSDTTYCKAAEHAYNQAEAMIEERKKRGY